MSTPSFVRGQADAMARAIIEGGEWDGKDFYGAVLVEVRFMVGHGPRRRVLLRPVDAAALVDRIGGLGRSVHLIDVEPMARREDRLVDAMWQVEADTKAG